MNSSSQAPPIRVLVAKPGLDGHDRGAKVLVHALRNAGMEVIYTGLHQTPEMIVHAAVQEDVAVLCVSILSGAHRKVFPHIMALLKEKDAEDIIVMAGGIIPDADGKWLKTIGVKEVFTSGTSLESIVECIRSLVTARNHDRLDDARFKKT